MHKEKFTLIKQKFKKELDYFVIGAQSYQETCKINSRSKVELTFKIYIICIYFFRLEK